MFGTWSGLSLTCAGGYGAFGSFFTLGFAVAGFVCGFGISPIHMSFGLAPSGVLSNVGVNLHRFVFLIPTSAEMCFFPLHVGHRQECDFLMASYLPKQMVHVLVSGAERYSVLHFSQQYRAVLVRGVKIVPQFTHFTGFSVLFIFASPRSLDNTASPLLPICR